MNTETFLANFGHVSNAPNGVATVRELVLQLAVQGKLVSQNPTDKPAHAYLKNILLEEKSGRKQRAFSEIAVENIPYSPPGGWAFVRNAQIISLRKGKKPSNLFTEPRGLPYLDISALERNDIRRYTDDVSCPQAAEKDLIIVCDGSRSGLVMDGKPGVLGSTLAAIESRLNKEFLKILLLASYESMNSNKKGAAIPHLDIPRFMSQVIGVPPISEQRRIVAKVEELMVLCDRLEAQQQERKKLFPFLSQASHARFTGAPSQSNLNPVFIEAGAVSADDLRMTVLSLAVQGKLVPQDSNDESASELMGKIDRQSHRRFELNDDLWERRTIPSSWTWTALGNYAECSRGRFSIRPRNDPSCYNGPYPFIQIRDLSDRGGLIKSHSQSLNDKGLSVSKMFKAGTVVVAIVGATIGNTGILAYDMCFPDSLVGLETGDPNSNRYVELFLLARKQHIRELSYSGGGQPNIKLSILNPFPFPLPPLAEQRRIVVKVDQLMALIDTLEKQQQEREHLAETFAKAVVASLTGTQIAERKEKMKAPKTELISTLSLGTKPKVKDDAPLATLLIKAKGELSAKSLWQQSGLTIDAFYQQLKTELARGWIAPPQEAEMKVVEEA